MISQEEFEQFVDLVERTCDVMNQKAQHNPSFYRSNDGKMMESVVWEEFADQARETIFEQQVSLVPSTRSFPDIIIGGKFGVEVKTSKSGWKSLGSSIMESTRIPGVEHIAMFSGKWVRGTSNSKSNLMKHA
ncbi:hypothetical protein [Exiguobacterium sp. AM39-5BH]|uniref:hypothetical protein n=1 Tax=Exiguobacterium sp. AM39-5BH TaxID=2292355 RepID=UPI000FE20FCA|nr:hypothetical protein [Exiguobacterium sp. AM39-5BH]RHB46846.1 hypothetical protein DW881_13485 [Exiguobacterium sp. AM39-5BH]